MNPTIDSAGAAELLRVHPETVEDMARRGELPAWKPGRSWLFHTEQLLRFIEARAAANLEQKRGTVLPAESDKTRRKLPPDLPK